MRYSSTLANRTSTWITLNISKTGIVLATDLLKPLIVVFQVILYRFSQIILAEAKAYTRDMILFVVSRCRNINLLPLLFPVFLTACVGGSDIAGPEPFDPGTPKGKLELRTRTDNPSAKHIVDYFRVNLGGLKNSKFDHRNQNFTRFSSPPTVRLTSEVTSKERALLHHAIGLINRELPQHLHLRIGSDVPHIGNVNHDRGDSINTIPNGEIHVYFSDKQSVGYPVNANSGGFAKTRTKYYNSKEPRVKHTLEASFVWVNDSAQMTEQQRLAILLHEMMHALGFMVHTNTKDHPSSLLGSDGPKGGFHKQWGSQIPEIDGAALRAVYRLPIVTTSDQFSVSSLGDWDTNSIELHSFVPTGNRQYLRFGVNHVNDVTVPWTSGVIPETDLVVKQLSSGLTTWRGELLGFTSSLRPVRGNTEIRINHVDSTVKATFTNLQVWDTGQTPGEIGTGESWHSGNMEFMLTSSGNFLRSKDGQGTLIGQFYGSSHGGVAGSVELDNLTASFGARR